MLRNSINIYPLDGDLTRAPLCIPSAQRGFFMDQTQEFGPP